MLARAHGGANFATDTGVPCSAPRWFAAVALALGAGCGSPPGRGPAVSVRSALGGPGSLTPPRWIYNDTMPAAFDGMLDPTGRDGNLSTPPHFVDPGGDFHLEAGSACIDAADPDLKDPDGTRADMGSFGGPR